MVSTFLGKNGRHVIDPADGEHLACCWDACERPGLMLYRVRIYEGVNPDVLRAMLAAGERHSTAMRTAAIYSWKVFCTERHKMFYVNAPRALNQLPACSPRADLTRGRAAAAAS